MAKQYKIGEWAFLAGVLLAIVLGFVPGLGGNMGLVLVVLGLLVGFLNVTEKESSGFLLAAVALMLTGTADLAVLPVVGASLSAIVSNISVFVAPAALVVALKAVYELGTKK